MIFGTYLTKMDANTIARSLAEDTLTDIDRLICP